MSHRAGKTRVLKGGRGTPYGHIKVLLGAKREGFWVHRLVLQVFVGGPASGQIACHKDGDPSNNALSNLEWGTHASNAADKERHGRTLRGSEVAQSKLTEDDVRAIRALRGSMQAAPVAEMFGIKRDTVYHIWWRKTWRHVA